MRLTDLSDLSARGNTLWVTTHSGVVELDALNGNVLACLQPRNRQLQRQVLVRGYLAISRSDFRVYWIRP